MGGWRYNFLVEVVFVLLRVIFRSRGSCELLAVNVDNKFGKGDLSMVVVVFIIRGIGWMLCFRFLFVRDGENL